LYWDFFMRHAAVFGRNPRLAMVYRQLANMPAEALDALRTHAASVRARLETL
jgi:deoxyribodipyrimidine photolyase-related protein